MGVELRAIEGISPYITFTREEWADLRAAVPLPLTEEDLRELRGINEEVSLEEVAAIYLPLARLLNLYVTSTQTLYEVTETFLGNPSKKVPYVIGLAGSVAAGKSTIARILRTLLEHWPEHPKVDLVTTDGFLYPNEVLEARGIMHRKGFPESYDLRRLLRFVADVKSGAPRVTAPVYSHVTYNIVPDAVQVVEEPDVVIIEGLNVLQSGSTTAIPSERARLFVSDFFDFSIYVDATEEDLEAWYVERFLWLCDTVFQSEESYFHRYAALSREEAIETARGIWRGINLVNLRENIATTRERARLILEKGADHSVQRVHLRKL